MITALITLCFIYNTYAQCILPPSGIPTFKTYWLNQTVDHYNYKPQDLHYQQRYLVWDNCWLSPTQPIFFYTGNEGDVEIFWNNTGFLFELAEIFGALVVFGEHRYYGQSLPFGSNSWDLDKIGYLSTEQALADYASMITYIKENLNAPNAHVYSFGGSYGGMLTAWFRMKYPAIISGALAGSAPIYAVSGIPFQPRFLDTVTKDYAKIDERCPDLVRDGYSRILDLASTQGGLVEISKKLNLCDTLKNKDDVDQLILWATNAYLNLAMLDYPYETNFEAPLPGWPVNQSCQYLLHSSGDLVGFRDAVGLYYNGTNGTLQCFDVKNEFVLCADQSGCGGSKSWDYQACTEMIYFISSNNQSDMFPPRMWTTDDLKAYCQKTWGVNPRMDWTNIEYGGDKITEASKIIFSNGLLDPWMGGGVLSLPSPNVEIILIENSAHHLDLRASNPADPQSVVKARSLEASIFAGWIFGDNVYEGLHLLYSRRGRYPWINGAYEHFLHNKIKGKEESI